MNFLCLTLISASFAAPTIVWCGLTEGWWKTSIITGAVVLGYVAAVINGKLARKI